MQSTHQVAAKQNTTAQDSASSVASKPEKIELSAMQLALVGGGMAGVALM